MKSKAKSFFKSKLKEIGKYFTSGKKGTTRVKKKTASPKTINKVKNAGMRAAPTKADDMARAKQYKSKNLSSNLSKKAEKPKKSTTRKVIERGGGPLLAGAAAYYMSKAGGGKDKKVKDNSPSTKKNFGMGMVDSTPKAKVKQGPPKPPVKSKTVKKKRSNIKGSSSYDADFTRKNLEKRGLKAKNFMSKENYAKTIKPKGVMTGPEMMKKKKDDGKAPMYEFGGTKGKVKAQYKMGGGKMKMAKYYSGGGTIFTGR